MVWFVVLWCHLSWGVAENLGWQLPRPMLYYLGGRRMLVLDAYRMQFNRYHQSSLTLIHHPVIPQARLIVHAK